MTYLPFDESELTGLEILFSEPLDSGKVARSLEAFSDDLSDERNLFKPVPLNPVVTGRFNLSKERSETSY